MSEDYDQYMGNDVKEVHLVAEVKGNARKGMLFHGLILERDRDWPFPGINGRPVQWCEKCKGRIYNAPIFDITDLKALACQINDDPDVPGNLKLKIHNWITARKCGEKHGYTYGPGSE